MLLKLELVCSDCRGRRSFLSTSTSVGRRLWTPSGLHPKRPIPSALRKVALSRHSFPRTSRAIRGPELVALEVWEVLLLGIPATGV